MKSHYLLSLSLVVMVVHVAYRISLALVAVGGGQ
jgi:hypothetical protein